MSGKPTARSGGRGGRGYNNRSYRSGGNKPSASKIVAKKKTTITDYVFYIGSAKQASEFETTSEFVINYIRKTYEYSSDIGNGLDSSLQPMDRNKEKPSLKISIAATDVVKAADAVQFGMEFRADYNQWCKQIRMYEDNCTKSYALIWERCAKALQNKLQS
eukprot:scaffold57559_cov54-Attheya_sp.AAC.2